MSVFDAYVRLEGTIRGSVKCDEPMARHTTYRIGGPAALYITCASLADLALTCEVCLEEGVEWTIVGKGSNLLVSDEGYDGAVITLAGEFSEYDFGPADPECAPDAAGEDPSSRYGNDCMLVSGAAVPVSMLVQQAFGRGLSGLECLTGVPGTLGGALFMNAGTRDEWIGSRVVSVTVYKPGCGLRSVRGDTVDWGYRSSGLLSEEIIVEASMLLNYEDKTKIWDKIQRFFDTRSKNQPLSTHNCGSVFKNPPGQSAARLIQSCGLAGASCGDAQISEKHANFIVNNGSASASEVLTLMHFARDRVKEEHAIRLAPEVKFLGFPR